MNLTPRPACIVCGRGIEAGKLGVDTNGDLAHEQCAPTPRVTVLLGEIRRRFEGFALYGAPGRYFKLPYGFRGEMVADGEILLLHPDTPDYPARIGSLERSRVTGGYNDWVLRFNWQEEVRRLWKLVGFEQAADTEDVPF
jgi:hypothetical protein